MKVTVNLTTAQARAVLNAGLSIPYPGRGTAALADAEQRIKTAILRAGADTGKILDRGCPTCKSPDIPPRFPAPCPDVFHDQHQAAMRAKYPNCTRKHPPCWKCRNSTPDRCEGTDDQSAHSMTAHNGPTLT